MPVTLYVAADEAAGRAECVEPVAGWLVRSATISTKGMPDWRAAGFS